MNTLSTYGLQEESPAEGYQSAVRLARRIVGVATAALGVTEGTNARYAAVAGRPMEEKPADVPLWPAVMDADAPIIIPDVCVDARWSDHPAAKKRGSIRFAAGIPLILPDGTRLGVLLLFDPTPRTLSDAEKASLHDLAGLLVEYAEQAASRAPRTAVSDNVVEGVFRGMPGRGLVYVNRACAHMFGYDRPKDMLAVSPHELYADPDRRDAIVAQLDREGVFERQEVRFRRADGSTFWGLLSGKAVYDSEGHVQYRDGTVVDITRRKEMEQQLRESEERWQRLVENHPEAVFINMDGRFHYANSAGAQLLGATTSDEVIGRQILDFLPDDVKPLIQHRQEMLQAGKATPPVAHTLRQLDGEQRIVEVNSVPITIGGEAAIQTVARDVTERRQAEQQLRAAEAKFRGLVEQSLVGIYIIQDEQFVYANPALAETLGYPREVLVASVPVRQVVHEEDRELVRRNLQKRLRGEVRELKYTFRIRRPDGTVRHVEVHGARTAHDGRPAVIGTLLDVTDRTEWEEQLIAAKEQAEEMSRLKSAFLASMSHEVRTPLTSIIGFAELISSTPESAVEFAELIQRGGKRLLWTLNSVLDFAQLEAGALELTAERVQLDEEVHHVVEQLRPRAEQKGIALRFEEPDAPLAARVDRTAFLRVATNLVVNAVKFTDEGHVTVVLRTIGEAVELQVIDTGIGIDADMQDAIFEEFRQVSTGAGRTHEGSGLGLTITRRLVELMGGTIAVDSMPGEGSTFTVRLPLKEESEGERPGR